MAKDVGCLESTKSNQIHRGGTQAGSKRSCGSDPCERQGGRLLVHLERAERGRCSVASSQQFGMAVLTRGTHSRPQGRGGGNDTFTFRDEPLKGNVSPRLQREPRRPHFKESRGGAAIKTKNKLSEVREDVKGHGATHSPGRRSPGITPTLTEGGQRGGLPRETRRVGDRLVVPYSVIRPGNGRPTSTPVEVWNIAGQH